MRLIARERSCRSGRADSSEDEEEGEEDGIFGNCGCCKEGVMNCKEEEEAETAACGS